MEQLEITLSLKGDAPIYEQIEKQIKEQVISGKLQANQPIPSMRALAKMLRVSVITVQKAYENLKRDGYIESAVGRGTTIAAVSSNKKREEKLTELKSCLKQAAELSRTCGMTYQELEDLLSLIYKESL